LNIKAVIEYTKHDDAVVRIILFWVLKILIYCFK